MVGSHFVWWRVDLTLLTSPERHFGWGGSLRCPPAKCFEGEKVFYSELHRDLRLQAAGVRHLKTLVHLWPWLGNCMHRSTSRQVCSGFLATDLWLGPRLETRKVFAVSPDDQ